MSNGSPTWLTRALRIVVVAQWASLVLGIVGSTATSGVSGYSVWAAAVLGAGFVVPSTFLSPERLFRQDIQTEILVVSGSLLTTGAATLTGGLDSPFLLLALTPTLLAAVVGGQRMGITTALLSASLLTGIALASDGFESIIANAGAIALFPLLALLVIQIRSILVELEQRAETLESASQEAEAALARLAHANDLLRRLTDVYADGSSNPVEVGRSALEAVVDAHPGSFATATLFDNQGPVVVARVGTDSSELVRTRIPLGDGNTTSGVVSIGTVEPLSEEARQDIIRLLRPLAVSFSNTMLLQDIARAAVHEERLRLARELHDEIGPALAALGLGLDALAMETQEEHVSKSVTDIRDNLGMVIDELRRIISDLRAEEEGSLHDHFRRLAAELEAPPGIDIEVSEQRSPPPIAWRQISAIVTESVRNAHRHAEASTIRIVGAIDRDTVHLTVADDGRGFEVASVPEGHFGLMGMRERADRIGADIDVRSGSTGTEVHVTWKDTR